MTFSKEKMEKRIGLNGLATFADNSVFNEIMDNLDGQPAEYFNDLGSEELFCRGKDGTCYFVKAVDCMA